MGGGSAEELRGVGGSVDTDACVGGMRMVDNGDSSICVHLPCHDAQARITNQNVKIACSSVGLKKNCHTTYIYTLHVCTCL